MTTASNASLTYQDSIPEPIRLPDRPGEMPSHLFVHGGLAPVSCRALEVSDTAAGWQLMRNGATLRALRQEGQPLWVQIRGLGDRPMLEDLLSGLDLDPQLWPLLLDAPQQARVDSFPQAVLVVLHQFSLAYNRCI